MALLLSGREIMTTDITLIICLIIGTLLCTYMAFRNRQVYNERKKTHNTIFMKDKNGRFINSSEISRLCNEMDSIATYNKMINHFWKRPSSFYKDFLTKLEASNKEKLKEEKK